MSASKDEDPMQLQNLLSSTSEKRTFLPNAREVKFSTSADLGLVSSGNYSPKSNDEQAAFIEAGRRAAPANMDLDRCYSWLRPEKQRHQSDSESSESSGWSVSSLPLPAPPDGGWGWFVVLGAFTISLICDGLAFCFGVLYSELLEQFQESKSKTSLLGSIFFGVPMILGPLASSLATRFGCRKVTMFGGFLAFGGFILSYFANSIDMLCFTFSVVVGAGFSCCYITSVVIVAFYFEKRRALATGLALCGTGVGTFSFAPLMDFLINEYGWRGLFLIMAGISLNLVVCGLLFVPLKFTESQRWAIMLQEFNKLPHNREEIEMAKSARFPNESGDTEPESEVSIEDIKALSVLNLPTFVKRSKIKPESSVLLEALRNSRNPQHTLQRYMKNLMMGFELNVVHAGEQSHGNTPLIDDKTYTITAASHRLLSETEDTIASMPSSILDDPTTVSLKTHAKPKETKTPGTPVDHLSLKLLQTKETDSPLKKENLSVNTRMLQSTHSPVTDSRAKKSHPRKGELPAMNMAFAEKVHAREVELMERRATGWHGGRHNALGIHLPLYRSDIFYRRLDHHGVPLKHCTLGTSCPELTDTTNDDAKRGYICNMLQSVYEETWEILRTMVDADLLRNPFFVIFSFSNFIYYFWCDVPYMYAADHAIDNGVDEHKAAFILSVIGIFNTLGQVVFGYAGDLNINLLNVYAVILSLAGVAVALVPFLTTYWAMCVAYAFFGFFVSVSLPLTTVLLVKYVGVARLSSAYGLLMLTQGIANLCGPPFAGWISDVAGSYNMAYYLSGAFYITSGIALFIVYTPGLRVEPYRQESLATDVVIAPPSDEYGSRV